jgi:peptidoglycan/xylan/chitin deacetylase (PgdA/CDA1 family)
MLIAVNFHYVRPVFDAPYPGIHGITPDQFESQLKLLAGAGTFVSAGEILAAVRGEARLAERALVVTFDDGLQEQYEHALPVLRRLGIPAIFFINTRPIAEAKVSSVHKIHLLRANLPAGEFVKRMQAGANQRGIQFASNDACQKGVEHYRYDEPETAKLKYLLNFVLAAEDRDLLIDLLFDDVFPNREAKISRELYLDLKQIADLGSQQSIGTHAHEHLPLGLLPQDAAERQIRESSLLIEQWTLRRPFALSYPYGSREASSPSVATAAQRLGIEFAFTMERAANRDLDAPLHLARFDNNDVPGGKASRWHVDDLFAAASPRTWYTK